mmetsp:Transcript_19782/g.31010  ORF Transcript_19782/g.31010 Transcript_19782/m.31010 type:complete len:207 (-) Transcript_19782:241-861(-)
MSEEVSILQIAFSICSVMEVRNLLSVSAISARTSNLPVSPTSNAFDVQAFALTTLEIMLLRSMKHSRKAPKTSTMGSCEVPSGRWMSSAMRAALFFKTCCIVFSSSPICVRVPVVLVFVVLCKPHLLKKSTALCFCTGLKGMADIKSSVRPCAHKSSIFRNPCLSNHFAASTLIALFAFSNADHKGLNPGISGGTRSICVFSIGLL